MKIGYLRVSKHEQNEALQKDALQEAGREKYFSARGRVGGRPKKLATDGKVALARRLFSEKNHSIDDICSTLGISRSTLYRYVREAKRASDRPE
jgi:DNA invertase Pin-like site-specific DNA recombinase